MTDNSTLESIKDYFDDKLKTYGATPQGADWNSSEAQNVRFDQLLKVINQKDNFSLIDYGSGYGALADYILSIGFNFSHYFGYDILEDMVAKGQELHPEKSKFTFTTKFHTLPPVDFAIASGVFNIKLKVEQQDWTAYVIKSLEEINEKVTKGFSVNFLTKYSDADRMLSHLYYADPGYLFDYAKKNFSKNVAVLHDYNLYDFTLIVRKF